MCVLTVHPVVFPRQSWALRKHFRGFLAATSSATQSQAAIKKLTFYMAMSSICMLLCSSSWLLLVFPYVSGGALVHGTETVYVLMLGFIYSRISFSFAQASLNTPTGNMMTSLLTSLLR